MMNQSGKSRSFILGVVFFLLLFGGYFLYQANDYFFGPSLSIDSPIDGETIHKGGVLIEGFTEPKMRVSINGFETFSNEQGFFTERLPLGSGFHIIEVAVKDRFGTEERIRRQIVVE